MGLALMDLKQPLSDFFDGLSFINLITLTAFLHDLTIHEPLSTLKIVKVLEITDSAHRCPVFSSKCEPITG